MDVLKVVIHTAGDQARVAVQGKDTDPAMETVTAISLEEALGAIPAVVARARERWATSPRNPKYDGPPLTPPPAPTPAATPRLEPAPAGAGQDRMF